MTREQFDKNCEALPCPMCGAQPRVVDLGGWEVICDCGVDFCSHTDPSKEGALAGWNSRMLPPSSTSAISEPWKTCEFKNSCRLDACCYYPNECGAARAPSATTAGSIQDIIAHALDDRLEPRNRLQGVIARLRQIPSEADVLQEAVDYLHLRGQSEAALMLKKVRHQLLPSHIDIRGQE